MDVLDRIKEQVDSNPVIVFMKGTPQFPQCGFSARTAEALKSCGERFAYVNVLADPEIFQNLPRFADWPTFPQVYVNGELIGGCDITLEMHANGDLQKLVKEAAQNWPEDATQ
jgi:monothiol glutaredoxin